MTYLKRLKGWNDKPSYRQASGKFLEESSHPYKRVCLSDGPSIQPSTYPSICRCIHKDGVEGMTELREWMGLRDNGVEGLEGVGETMRVDSLIVDGRTG